MSPSLTSQLARLAVDARTLPATSAALHHAKCAVIDTLGVMIAGQREPAVVQLARTLRLATDAPAPDRLGWAMLSGTAAHILDYDDVALGGHPSAVLVPALLALARQIPLPGGRFLRAYTAGYEVWGELRRRHPVLAHTAGWHPSGITGPIAAAAACACALDLDAVQTRHALAIAASQSAGLVANFGTPVKALHIGRAVQGAVLAGLLAQHGMTGNGRVLEQEDGWLTTFSPHHGPDRLSPIAYGRHDWLLATRPPAIKCYPVCYAAHRAIESARQFHHQFDGKLPEIARITLVTSRRHSDILRFRRPVDRMQCCFSLEFAVAATLLDGTVTLASLSECSRQRPALRQLMARCQRQVNPEPDVNRDGFAAADWIEVTTAGGEWRRGQPIMHAAGDVPASLGDGYLRQKFIDCLLWGGELDAAPPLFDALMNMEAVPRVGDLPLYSLLTATDAWPGDNIAPGLPPG